MPVPFIMPKFDMDQEKATLVSWLKKEGERVEYDEIVLVVETEKVAIDVPCPASGTLAGICAHEGDVIPVTQVIAYILKEGETLPPSLNGVPAQTGLAGAGQTALQAAPPGIAASIEPSSPPPQRQVSPVARRMAKDLG
jgi:pyruvate/2-oxoglutarate dehydrogenase complex dihydrolipoamide acyltransferase (E2) component